MSIHLDKNGRRIELRSSQPLSGMKTAVPGAYLNTSGVWTVPLSVESWRLLRKKFNGQLTMSSELKRWVAGVLEHRKYMRTLASMEDAELTVLPDVAPKLYKAMNARTYQRVGARFIADGMGGLIADDPGLGKTLESMGAVLESETPGPYLIIAPKTASESVWGREIRRWLPADHHVITLPDSRDQRDRKLRLTRYGPKTWLIVHPEIVMVQAWWICRAFKKNRMRCLAQSEVSSRSRKLPCGHMREPRGRNKTEKLLVPSYPKLFSVEWGVHIVDESHEMLIRRSSQLTQRRRGLDMLKLRKDGMKIAISGTPYNSRPHQLWGTLNWLDPKAYSAFNRWAELYWQKGGYTGHQIGEFRKDREKLLWDSLSSVAIRRTKAEVAQDLPPKIFVGTPFDSDDKDSPVGIWLDMDGKQEEAYRSMERAAVAELEGGERLVATTGLSELTRLKQLACAYGTISRRVAGDEIETTYHPALPSNKYNWTRDALEEWGYPHEPLTKVVIVSFYTGILRMFKHALEAHFKAPADRPLCVGISGRTPQHQRTEIIDLFNKGYEDSPHVLLLNVKAGGTAITLDTADRMIFISETRIPDQQTQATDRIHRISNPRTCMYYFLRTLNTVDVGTAHINAELERESHRLLDGRRGIDYVRYVMKRQHG